MSWGECENCASVGHRSNPKSRFGTIRVRLCDGCRALWEEAFDAGVYSVADESEESYDRGYDNGFKEGLEEGLEAAIAKAKAS